MRIRGVGVGPVRKLFTARPRLLASVVALLAVVVFIAAGAMAWLSYDIASDLPDKNALRGLGEMAQATTIHDASDTPVFTIFKEQRLEVPLDRVSRNLINAVVAIEDQRFYDHG